MKYVIAILFFFSSMSYASINKEAIIDITATVATCMHTYIESGEREKLVQLLPMRDWVSQYLDKQIVKEANTIYERNMNELPAALRLELCDQVIHSLHTEI